jgi:hypothetical protein
VNRSTRESKVPANIMDVITATATTVTMKLQCQNIWTKDLEDGMTTLVMTLDLQVIVAVMIVKKHMVCTSMVNGNGTYDVPKASLAY